MEFLSIDYIKQHLRLDFDCEDQLLELYGDAAEEVVASYVNRGRTVGDMVKSLEREYGKLPSRIYQAALMLVDHSYQQRGVVSAQNMSVVPYGFDMLVKPFMRLADEPHHHHRHHHRHCTDSVLADSVSQNNKPTNTDDNGE